MFVPPVPPPALLSSPPLLPRPLLVRSPNVLDFLESWQQRPLFFRARLLWHRDGVLPEGQQRQPLQRFPLFLLHQEGSQTPRRCRWCHLYGVGALLPSDGEPVDFVGGRLLPVGSSASRWWVDLLIPRRVPVVIPVVVLLQHRWRRASRRLVPNQLQHQLEHFLAVGPREFLLLLEIGPTLVLSFLEASLALLLFGSLLGGQTLLLHFHQHEHIEVLSNHGISSRSTLAQHTASSQLSPLTNLLVNVIKGRVHYRSPR